MPLCRLGSVHSGSASWDDYGRAFPYQLPESSFPWWVPTLCLDGMVCLLRLRWVKVVCVFIRNLPTADVAEWPGSFTCHCGNAEVERTSNKSQHTKLTLEKKILPPLLPGFELTTFRSQVRCLVTSTSSSIIQQLRNFHLANLKNFRCHRFWPNANTSNKCESDWFLKIF